jgi:hypothetical protein
MVFIESANSALESVSRLLDIVRRGRDKDFEKFLDCLLETGQGHVASLLQNTEEPSQLD